MCNFSMCILFGIINKAYRGVLAGMIELINASQAFLKTAIAWAFVFSAFQSTYEGSKRRA